MTAPAPTDLARDRAQMIRALARLADLLGEHAAGASPSAQPLELDPESALARVCAAFGLSAFECDVLTLAAAPELDGSFPALCGQAAGEVTRSYPTLSLALAALPNPAWSALLPEAPLRFWRLIEFDGVSLTGGMLRADEAIVNTLLGFPHADHRLRPYAADLGADDVALSGAQDDLARTIAGGLETHPQARLQVVSHDRALGRALAERVASLLGRRASLTRFTTMPAISAELVELLHLWQRDLLLRGGLAVLECDDGEDPQRERLLQTLVERAQMPLLLLAPVRLPLADAGVTTFEARRPTREEQAMRWTARLGADAPAHELAAQFDVSLATIDAAAAAVESPDAGALAVAVRTQIRPRLDGLAERVDTSVRWRDLVLPVDRRRVLRGIVDHVRQRDRVYREWGFSRDDDSGQGLTVLFSGASGTGKSLAARVLANVLRLDLYRVDLASVFSKYIGETEKNLRRIFDAAEGGGMMLLFDEADALFGKRSEVKDSHDRHANVEVSYLLQRLERFNGVAVLTTNLREVFDTAFLRRFRVVLEFPFPDATLRERIWRRAFPSRAPLGDLDFPLLAKLPIPGGNIHNIALNAGVGAAAKRRSIGMEDVAAAVRAEYAKLDRVTHDPALARWLEAVPARGRASA